MNKNIKKQQGFTLFELLVVTLILGVLVASFSGALVSYLQKSKQSENSIKIDEIETALITYFNAYGKLPCPALADAKPDTANFGRQLSADCTSVPASPALILTTNTGKNIRIGSLPTRDLNLPDEYMLDSYSKRFIYAVTETSASAGQFNINDGAIGIVDSNGNSVITPANSAHYAIVSTGADGFGSYNLEGNRLNACVGSTAQLENCNDDGIFRSTELVSTSTTADQIDDTVVYKLFTTDITPSIPSGAVMAFDSATCPLGWSPVPELQGRTIVGAGNYNNTYTDTGFPSWIFNKTYTLNEIGGRATTRQQDRNVAPHVHDLNRTTISYTVGPDSVDVVTSMATELSTNVSNNLSGDEELNVSPYFVLTYCKYN